MIVISVRFKIQADKIEEGKAAFIFSQNVTTAEDGCISFRLYQDLEDPTLFFLF